METTSATNVNSILAAGAYQNEATEIPPATNDKQRACQAGKALIIDLTSGIGIDRVVHEIIHNQPKPNLTMWIFAGDHREVAIHIGRTYQLIRNYSNIIFLDQDTKKTVDQMEISLLEVSRGDFAHSVAVVDGRTLDYVRNGALGDLLFKLASVTDSVICYRTSPVQRASLLNQIHDRITRTYTLVLQESKTTAHEQEYERFRQISRQVQVKIRQAQQVAQSRTTACFEQSENHRVVASVFDRKENATCTDELCSPGNVKYGLANELQQIELMIWQLQAHISQAQQFIAASR